MHKRTKASQIPREVKERVYERDDGKCLICGKVVTVDNACAHFVSRARMGLGCEENILTLCHDCHRLFDGYHRKEYEPLIKRYMQAKYPGWSEDKLVYSKWGWTKCEY